MLYTEVLYFESLPLEKKVFFIFESINKDDLKNTNSAEISKLKQELQKEKYREYFNKKYNREDECDIHSGQLIKTGGKRGRF